MDYKEIAKTVAKEETKGKTQVESPELLVLVGLQYSGKSTLAQKIAEHNYVHFWATKVKKRFELRSEDKLQVAEYFTKLVLAKRYNMILDYTNHTQAIRRRFEDIANSLGISYRVIYLDVPYEELLKRRKQNVTDGDLPGRRVIGVEEMEKFYQAFEPPVESENPISIKTDKDSSEFLKSLED